MQPFSSNLRFSGKIEKIKFIAFERPWLSSLLFPFSQIREIEMNPVIASISCSNKILYFENNVFSYFILNKKIFV